MPKGPRGEKGPADVIGAAVKVMRIATGVETEELETDRAKSAAAELGSRGGRARAQKLSAERRRAIAQIAAEARYKDSRRSEVQKGIGRGGRQGQLSAALTTRAPSDDSERNSRTMR
jgi:hypothetical protein